MAKRHATTPECQDGGQPTYSHRAQCGPPEEVDEVIEQGSSSCAEIINSEETFRRFAGYSAIRRSLGVGGIGRTYRTRTLRYYPRVGAQKGKRNECFAIEERAVGCSSLEARRWTATPLR